MFQLYSLLLTAGFILMLPVFFIRREKYASGFRQRMGRYPEFAPDNREVIWIHCVSVGETNAARPLIDALKREFPGHRLIVSTVTRTGQDLAKNIFEDQADAIFYFPFDFKFAVRRALDHFRPNTVLIVETEIWANFIREAGKRNVSLALVNGRLSPKSHRNYYYVRGFMRRVLTYFDAALMQSNADATRLMSLGIHPKKVKVTGNVKFDQPTDDSSQPDSFRDRFCPDGRPVVLAASTHSPEESLLLDAFRRLPQSAGGKPRLFVAPRHPERFAEVAGLLKSSGFSFARRSEAPSAADRDADLVLLDSVGELRSFYPLADIVFVGGSLIPHGGQSILEPAAAARAIVTGPFTTNFSAAVAAFREHDALLEIASESHEDQKTELEKALGELLGDSARRTELGANALAVMKENQGATRKTIEILRPLIGGKVR